MSVWLKWILLLPASLVAMIVVRLLYRVMIANFIGTSEGYQALIDELFITAAATGAYLYVGTRIAPARKFATAIVLSLVYAVLLIVAFALFVSQHGGILPGGENTYSYWGAAVAVVTCIAYCYMMSKKRNQPHNHRASAKP